MSREVSVVEMADSVTDAFEVAVAMADFRETYGDVVALRDAIVAVISRSVLLERVAEAADDLEDGWDLCATTYCAKCRAPKHACDGFLKDAEKLKSALAALRDHDKLGKEGAPTPRPAPATQTDPAPPS